jgi:hypothetical protein
LTLDYNHRPSFADRVNAAVDRALTADHATRPPRDYLGGSRLGHACERALQFEFTATPKDEGQDFSGQSLRIFAIGHALEDLAVAWLRGAGFDLYTRKGNRPDGGQFGFSVAGGRIRGHVDGIIAAWPEGFGLIVPALWECKTMNAKNWRACVKDGVTKSKPVYAAQIALYQAYMEGTGPRHLGRARAVHRDQQGYGRTAPRTGALRRRSRAAHVRPGRADPAGDRCGRASAARRHHARLLRMPLLPVVRALLEAAGMSDDGILHFNPWMDFNDGPPSENPFGCDPDPEQIAVFLDIVFSWCEGLIPLRGFVDKGQGRDGKPHNIWIPADDTAPGKLATFAGVGEPRGRGRLCHPRHGRGTGSGPRRRCAADAGHRRRSRRRRHPGQAGPCHPPPRHADADHRERRADARGCGQAPCLVETDRTGRGRRPAHPLPPCAARSR